MFTAPMIEVLKRYGPTLPNKVEQEQAKAPYAPQTPVFDPLVMPQMTQMTQMTQMHSVQVPDAPTTPVQFDPIPTSVQPQQDRFLYDDGWKQTYQQNVNDMLTGKTFDPIRAQTQESNARQDAQTMANTAYKINKFGGLGQGIGDQVASSTMSDIARDRFDQNLKLDIAENEMKQQGLQEVRNSVTAEGQLQNIEQDKIALEQDRFAFDQDKKAKAGESLAAYVQSHVDLQNMTPEQMMKDRGFRTNMQNYWESVGGTGEVPPAWAEMQVKAITDPRLTNSIVASYYEIDQAITAGVYSAEEGQLLKDFNAQGLLQFIKRDEDGNAVFDYETLRRLVGEEGNGEGGDGDGESDSQLSQETIDAAQYTPSQMTVKQVKDVFAAYKTDPDSVKDVITNADAGILQDSLVEWGTDHRGTKKKRWNLTSEAKNFVNTHTGQFFEVNGKLYRLIGMTEKKKERNFSEYITFEDEDGNLIKINNAGGRAKKYNWPSA